MPQAKQRRTFPFDARSVMLFAAITVGGATAYAQLAPPARSSDKTQFSVGPTFGPGPSSTVQASFERADTNHDGRLSAAEAAALPAIANRFKELDTNHDGALTLSELEAGANR